MQATVSDTPSTPLIHRQPRHISNAFSTPVVIVLVMAICTMIVISCIDWTLLLYLNHTSLVPNTDAYYITASAFALCAPIVLNPILGLLSFRFGSGVTLSYGYIVVAFGILLIILFRSSPTIFMIGYLLYAPLTTYRIVRLSILAEIVSLNNRTAIMALHQLMAPVGAFLSPMLWIYVQRWKGERNLGHFLAIDRFTAYYLFAIGLLAVMFVLGILHLKFLSQEEPSNAGRGESTDGEYGATSNRSGTGADHSNVHVVIPDDTQHAAPNRGPIFDNFRFLYFSLLLLLMQSTMALIRVSFQPVLVEVYGTDEENVGRIYGIVAALSLLPPIIVAVLSRIMNDRAIILFGILLKMVGASLWLPLFGEVRRWQCVAGFMLCVKASQFFTTAAISAFTKTVGKRGSQKQLGYMWSIGNIGPALLQLGVAGPLLKVFGSWWFVASVVPVIVGFAMVLHPWGWKQLGDRQQLE